MAGRDGDAAASEVSGDAGVTSSSLHVRLSLTTRLDVVPFVLLYAVLLGVMVQNEVLWDLISAASGLGDHANDTSTAASKILSSSNLLSDVDLNKANQETILAAVSKKVNEALNEEGNGLQENADLDVRWSEWELIAWALAVVVAVFSHAMALLGGFWSVTLRRSLRYRPARSIDEAEVICVIPAEHCGTPAICKLHKRRQMRSENRDAKSNGNAEASSSKRGRSSSSSSAASNGKPHGTGGQPPKIVSLEMSDCWFEFQRKRFGLVGSVEDAARSGVCKFEVLDFPDRRTIHEYLSWPGHESEHDRLVAREKWGRNEFDIPLPPLQDLFIENALSPFFLFQVLCVALWCLDEYWYYSVFTLFMLILFELTVCKQRQQNLGILRGMRHPPYPVWVYRAKQWTRALSTDLVPGDIASLVRPTNMFRQLPDGSRIAEDDENILVPCDFLLLRGSCVVNEAMLTGESVPKMKESLLAIAHGNRGSDKSTVIDTTNHEDFANNVVLGGTRVIQHSAEVLDPIDKEKAVGLIPLPPDGGCLAIVLRTGFYTSQGSLMRTILFSTEHVTVGDKDTFFFILGLLVFAVLASAYVLIEGLKDDARSRWKLFLHCIMIITSVVPPELPMELSLAVNTSLSRLYRLAIFCTEPYRIPFAGRLDVCCFDKTGTLTSDAYFVKGIANKHSLETFDIENKDLPKLTPATEARNEESTYVIAGCHQLVRLQDKVEGDPMEQAAVRAIRWAMTRDGRMIMRGPSHESSKRSQIRILHRHPFSSTLKRMSSCIAVDTLDPLKRAKITKLMVVCKGAPEVMEDFLEIVPNHYRESYQALMMAGGRVLTLAYKELSERVSEHSASTLSRVECESRLIFAGLLVLDCPLKDDTLDAVNQLRESRHRVVMITGDNALTACDVARQLNMVSENHDEILLLSSDLEWNSIDPSSEPPDDAVRKFDRGHSAAVLEEHERKYLVVTGAAIDAMEEELGGSNSKDFLQALQRLCPHVSVFARVSPRHKEIILASLAAAGRHALMCGDGTNDVGALKQADVGVSIINSPEHEDAMKRAREEISDRYSQERLSKLSAADRLRAEIQAMEDEKQGSSVVQLGDASIASPFTSKSTSIMSTVHIIRQGRCTLVTTIQMYKILALNCLISAYSMSALYLYGVKQGDTQATIAGLLIAGLFMFISWAEPLETLSRERPVASVFSASVMSSLAGQLAIHFASLFTVLHLAEPFVKSGAEEMKPDAEFKPNVVNSAVFLVGLCMQCNVFGSNYHGHPFMQSLWENKLFHRVLFATWGLSVVLATDAIPGLGDAFELVQLPTEDGFHLKLVSILLLDTICSWSWEALSRRVFRND